MPCKARRSKRVLQLNKWQKKGPVLEASFLGSRLFVVSLCNICKVMVLLSRTQRFSSRTCLYLTSQGRQVNMRAYLWNKTFRHGCSTTHVAVSSENYPGTRRPKVSKQCPCMDSGSKHHTRYCFWNRSPQEGTRWPLQVLETLSTLRWRWRLARGNVGPGLPRPRAGVTGASSYLWVVVNINPRPPKYVAELRFN